MYSHKSRQRLMTRVSTGAALAVTLLQGGCGSGSSSTSSPPPQTPAAPVAVASVVVMLTANGLAVGETTTANATLRDASGNVLTGRNVIWASSDPAVATVSQAGLLAAVAPGSATLTATSEGNSGGSALVVATHPDASVVLAVDPAILPGIDRSLSQFMTDLAWGRYHVLHHPITEKTPPQLRQTIRDYYERLAPKLEGVIVIGSAPIPTSTFEYPNPPGTCTPARPCSTTWTLTAHSPSREGT